MATQTTYLHLTKPGFNEFFDSWHDVVNANMDLIDTAVGALQTLTAGAAGSVATIDARFLAAEAATAALAELNDIKDGWTEGVPAVPDTFLGPNDPVVGQADIGKVFHSLGLQLAELSGVVPLLDVESGLASRMQQGPQGILSAVTPGTLLSFGGVQTVRVNPTGDCEVLVNGRYGIIRNGEIRDLATGGGFVDARWLLAATGVGWNTSAGAADGATSGSVISGSIAGTEARAGDLLEITVSAGSNENLGLYVIESIALGSVTIKGSFPTAVTGQTFQFRRRHYVDLALKRWGTDILSIVNGQGYDGAGALVGTVLGHDIQTAGGVFQAGGPRAEYPAGLHYDSGWQPSVTFFDGNPLAAAVETRTLNLPDIPATWQLLWSPNVDGSDAVQVPLDDDAGAYGIRVWWNMNEMSVQAPTPANLLHTSAGVAVGTGVGAGDFSEASARLRLIARG